MPMSHRTAMQVIKRRLVGKEGAARVKVLRAALDELPGYKNGPYADLRKWVLAELDQTRQRARVEHRDSIAVKRQGVAQVAVVGPPNAGKSSLLQALSDVQIKTGDYAFTTTRPIPAVIRAGGVLVQLVEIPGLIEGASEDRGGGKALLSVLRTADAMVLCHDLTAAISVLDVLRAELDAAGIDLPAIVAATKGDEAQRRCARGVTRCGARSRRRRRVDPRRRTARRVPRGGVAAHGSGANRLATRRRARRQHARVGATGDGPRCGARHPQGAGRQLQGRAPVGPVGPLPWRAASARRGCSKTATRSRY